MGTGPESLGSLTDRPGAIRNVGTHYNPQTTWFEQSKAFNLYLSRCSWLLSQGRFVADALVYAGDAINVFAGTKDVRDALGPGFDYDFCPTELLLQAKVENGEIVLPSGMRYKTLVLSDKNPAAKRMAPGKLPPVTATPPPSVSHFIPADARTAMAKTLPCPWTRIRAGIPGVRPYDPKGEKKASLKPLAMDDRVFFPVADLPMRRVLGGVTLGEAYNTDIADVVACVKRAGARKEVLVLSSHGIHPDAKNIHLKTEWLEQILAAAQEADVSVFGLDELPVR